MRPSSRLPFLALAGLLLISAAHLARPPLAHGDPMAMAGPKAHFSPLPPLAGVDEPVVLTVDQPESAAAIARQIAVRPSVPVRVERIGRERYRLLPVGFWPGAEHLTIGWSGFQNHTVLTTDDSREVVVDLTTQTLTGFEDGRIVHTVRVSTGVSPKWTTPSGTFWVFRRVQDDHMVGGKPDDPDHWDVNHVPYAQYIHGGIALHGAWWNHRFGHPVSHGCIQLPTAEGPDGPTGDPAEAEWLWHFTHLGTPVLIIGHTPEVKSSATAPLPYPTQDSREPKPATSGASSTR